MGGMDLQPAACYQAVLARDARYDGRFFTCVKTTGIYCRPVCPARPPHFENCCFVPSAAAAQEAGFRPCLRCRPESSPGLGAWCGTSNTVKRALRLIDDGALDHGDINALADRLGVGERQLRRLFKQHVGAAPIAVAQTRRVLLAKQLIHQTPLPMTDVALASGFGSVRRFNETFLQLYNRPPGELRRLGHASNAPGRGITLLLPYRPPYDWPAILAFLQTRAIPGVEQVDDDRYRRVIELDGTTGTLQVSHAPKQQALRVTVHFAELRALQTIVARVRRIFDLEADPVAIGTSLSRDALLAPLVAARPGLRVPGAWDGFELAVRGVLGQQITVAAATRLAGKLVAAIGRPLAGLDAAPGLTHAFPGPDAFTQPVIEALGMPRTRAATLVNLATAVQADPHLFEQRDSLVEAVSRLRELPGIGEWTAQYIAMRALRESDAFLAGDVALQRIVAVNDQRPRAAQLLARAEAWRPWRAYAVLHLWTADGASPSQPTTRLAPRKPAKKQAGEDSRHAITP